MQKTASEEEAEWEEDDGEEEEEEEEGEGGNSDADWASEDSNGSGSVVVKTITTTTTAPPLPPPPAPSRRPTFPHNPASTRTKNASTPASRAAEAERQKNLFKKVDPSKSALDLYGLGREQQSLGGSSSNVSAGTRPEEEKRRSGLAGVGGGRSSGLLSDMFRVEREKREREKNGNGGRGAEEAEVEIKRISVSIFALSSLLSFSLSLFLFLSFVLRSLSDFVLSFFLPFISSLLLPELPRSLATQPSIIQRNDYSRQSNSCWSEWTSSSNEECRRVASGEWVQRRKRSDRGRRRSGASFQISSFVGSTFFLSASDGSGTSGSGDG